MRTPLSGGPRAAVVCCGKGPNYTEASLTLTTITTVQGPVTQVTNFSTVPSPTSQTWLGTRDHTPQSVGWDWPD